MAFTLNKVGTDNVQSFFQQVLIPEYVHEQEESKRVKRLAALPYWVSSKHKLINMFGPPGLAAGLFSWYVQLLCVNLIC